MTVKELLEMCDSFCGDESFLIFDSFPDYASIFYLYKVRLNYDDCMRDYGHFTLKRFYTEHDKVFLLVEVPS
jgi:hypothetical protein